MRTGEYRTHQAVPLKLPRTMRPTTAAIDDALAPVIRECWRLGLVTTYCCEGKVLTADMHPSDLTLHLAYIAFADPRHASARPVVAPSPNPSAEMPATAVDGVSSPRAIEGRERKEVSQSHDRNEVRVCDRDLSGAPQAWQLRRRSA